MTTETLWNLVRRYRAVGILWHGRELLLSPEHAISLVDDLDRIGVAVLGCDFWRWNNSAKGFMELAGAGMGVDSPRNSREATLNAETVKRFLRERFPPDAELVSFVFDDPSVDQAFLTYTAGTGP